MTSVLRRCSSWLLRPVWRPIEKMIERRVAPLELEARQRLAKLDSQADTIEQILYQRAGALEGRVDQLEAAISRLEKGWRHHCPAVMSGFSALVQLEQDVRTLRQDVKDLRGAAQPGASGN
ncbi:hypothetical protein ACT6QG_06195 [Xanthobacter sp. TB0136]|uniref:hypothetical protein n=1 Tax=Xanthobacter sp. TB0136 TaxID=3459177 RepID=UPI00403A6AC6